ncbi:MAG: glutamine amidotransferase [Candidatus Saccharibacteria bacterium]|nr:glutamine amidotransferase [Candidatus Saccharibacteria bacterium]
MSPIRIVQLYPRDMNLYGDWGNTLALKKRLGWRGMAVEVIDYNAGDIFPESADIVVGGGGQDSGQKRVAEDLQRIAPRLQQLADDGMPMLMICGMYQLFGERFITKDGAVLPGAGILGVETRGGDERLIGNIVLESDEFGTIVGYENHSGQTTLNAGVAPLGTVRLGAGNTAAGDVEGARYRNVIGTYLHGSLLPRNPQIADFLIAKALERRGETTDVRSLDIDKVAKQAHTAALQRKR